MIQIALSVSLFFQPPDGFPPEDRFDSIEDACLVMAGELAPKEYRHPAMMWCLYRAKQSTRGSYESRIDGSQIHDRDRHAAYQMWRHGVRAGRIDPWACDHDAIDYSVKHSAAAKKLAREWPYDSPEMTEKKRKRWMRSPAGAEVFGTRGPIDLNTEFARRFVPGCWDPESLDRNDVSAAVTVLGAAHICETWGCKGIPSIKRKWR